MKSLWSGLDGIKGGIISATKNLKELASEINEDAQPEKQDTGYSELKDHNAALVKQLLGKEEELQLYKSQLESMKKSVSGSQDDTNKLLSFKIVIGMEDSANALQMMEAANDQLKAEKQRNQDQRFVISNLESLKLSAERDLENCSKALKSVEFELEVLKETSAKEFHSLREKSEAEIKRLKDQSIKDCEKLGSLQESLLNYKRNIHSNVETCYSYLKESCAVIGISIPQIRPENLGLEDIQEFLYTETQFITESINKIYTCLKGKFDIKQIKSLEGVKDAILHISEEASKKVMEYKEIAMASENLFQQAKRENIELIKKFNDISKALEECKKIVGKKEEEIAKLRETCRNVEELTIENEKLSVQLKKSLEANLLLESDFSDEKQKFERTYTYVSSLEEDQSELKHRLKTAHSLLQERDQALTLLSEQNHSLTCQLTSLHQQSAFELDSLKQSNDAKLKELTEKSSTQISRLSEAHRVQIQELQIALSNSLNECKDLNTAKAQVRKYEEGIERLQDLVKNLESQLNSASANIERLVQENEAINSKLVGKSSKLKELRYKHAELAEEVETKAVKAEEERRENAQRLKEAEDMKKEAEGLLEKVQSRIQVEDNLIDRRLVTTFLVNYLNEQNTEKMKLQMLRPLAEMLGMDKEQKAKIGLEQDQGLLAQFATFLARG